ncbi:acyltransferase [Photobacterium damselae]|uniref:acyltransferase n=1 Tax=Photobacterium damselae TaxID=38293 RepID=UPI003D7EA426
MLKKSIKIQYLLGLPKTLYFNLKYFGFKKGIKLPVILSSNVLLRNCKGCVFVKEGSRIRIGFGDVGIFDIEKRRTIWDVTGLVNFLGDAFIGHGTKINVLSDGELVIGDSFRISAESSIICTKKIIFGINNLISWDVLIMDSDFHHVVDNNNQNRMGNSSDIIFSDNVWIGCRCLITKGVFINNNTVISAGTTLYKKCDKENVILSSNNQIVIKTDVSWVK